MADSTKVAHLTDDNFDAEVINQKTPVLVDFWASWCAPCKAIAPILEDLAEEYAGQVKIAKLNVDEQPNTASALGIRALPTLLLFKDGQVIDQIVGAVPKSKLDALLKAHV